MKRRLLYVLVLTFFASTVFAQTGDLALHLFVVGSLPNGDFGKDVAANTQMTRRSGFNTGNKVGLAKSGFGCGAELISPVWFRGLNWVFSTKILVNGVDGEVARAKFRSELGDSVDLQFRYGQWLNIPVMTGFRYDHHFTHRYTLYGILQAGLNLSKAPSKMATVGEITAEDTKYEFARDFGFEVGLGFMLNQTYNLEFRYLALSTPRYDGTRKLSEKVFPEIFSRKSAILGEERSISMFIVTIGIQLFR